MDAWNFIIIAALAVREGNAVKPNYCLPYQLNNIFYLNLRSLSFYSGALPPSTFAPIEDAECCQGQNKAISDWRMSGIQLCKNGSTPTE